MGAVDCSCSVRPAARGCGRSAVALAKSLLRAGIEVEARLARYAPSAGASTSARLLVTDHCVLAETWCDEVVDVRALGRRRPDRVSP